MFIFYKNFGKTPALFFLIIIFVLLAGAGCVRSAPAVTPADEMNKETQSMPETQNNDAMMEKNTGESAIETDNAMMDSPEVMTEDTEAYTGNVLAGERSKLYDFNQADYDRAKASDKLVVVYFYANWCPVCKDEVQNSLYPFFNDYADDDIIGFRVNYNDNQTDADETALAREFGVAYQHTKVFVKNNQRVLKSPESWDKNRYNEAVSQAR